MSANIWAAVRFLYRGYRLSDAITVRAGGHIELQHCDTVWLTPDEEQTHGFDTARLRIA